MICIPITARTTDEALQKMVEASSLADLVEIRIDRMREVDLTRLLRMPRPPVIVTNRRREEGGGFAGTEEERVSLLVEAARLGADYVDIETATAPPLKEVLRQACARSGTKRIASWHDFSGTPPADLLQVRLAEGMADGAAIVKMVTLALDAADNLRILELLPHARRMGEEITAFCMGEKGKFGRIAAHLLGGAISYASREEGEASASGQLTADQMREILRIVSPSPSPLPERDGLFALFGNPVAQSLSPLMHNAAFAGMGIGARYRAIRVDDAAEIPRKIHELGLDGASVTLPFKESVMPYLDEVEESAREIGAVNTIIHREGRLVGYNTDGSGLIRDLEEWIDIPGKSFAILGAGGAARAAVHALLKAGGIPVVFSRTEERGRTLAARFGCGWQPLSALARERADVLINTTPVGMFPDTDRTPLAAEELIHFPQVMDMIYNPCRTRLLREAEAAGCRVRPGVGMFVHQGAEQIRLWTGQDPPRAIMRQTVLERLGENGED